LLLVGLFLVVLMCMVRMGLMVATVLLLLLLAFCALLIRAPPFVINEHLRLALLFLLLLLPRHFLCRVLWEPKVVAAPGSKALTCDRLQKSRAIPL